ncbi:replication-relaxation family protein [Phytohabitans sp. ZYX-F-186]|uniref:Replication-relaxation family protein n=1 Tax=Phytohabitans maris TaxID=3071409 RepID=A0ABU0ZG58_9ACTN|nr:replication-relaxation family protein [Phytohabitans sp. ZYX-F-186]MDQ7905978.1 replication-relaxation family protein [Phytohabitans sp. ZYX-F-186]
MSGTNVPDVASELRRLMPRDRWLLDLLHDHQVFTTEQVAALGFDHVHTARNRLNLLHGRGVLAKFRDAVRPGSQSWRWALGWIGAAYIAYRDGRPFPRPGTIADRVNRLAASPRLPHLLGVNAFFVDLAAHARTTPGARLGTWWSERRCRDICGDLAHPDGHGVWTEDGSTVSFWLEYDRASEPTRRVLEKLDGYQAVHQAAGLNHAVLIRMQTARQETTLHQRLPTHPAVTVGGLLVATMSGDYTTHPAGPVWLPVGHTHRVRLAHLPNPPAVEPRAA